MSGASECGLSIASEMGGTQEIDSELCVIVKCGGKTAEFFPSKLKRTGKSLSKCIKHGGRWLNPNEFESLAGLHQAKKWKQSIRCKGKALGESLAEFGKDTSFDSSQKCVQQQGNVQVKQVQVSDSSNCTRHNELGAEDNGLHNATVDDSAQKPQSQQASIIHAFTPSDTSGAGLHLFLPRPLALI